MFPGIEAVRAGFVPVLHSLFRSLALAEGGANKWCLFTLSGFSNGSSPVRKPQGNGWVKMGSNLTINFRSWRLNRKRRVKPRRLASDPCIEPQSGFSKPGAVRLL